MTSAMECAILVTAGTGSSEELESDRTAAETEFLANCRRRNCLNLPRPSGGSALRAIANSLKIAKAVERKARAQGSGEVG